MEYHPTRRSGGPDVAVSAYPRTRYDSFPRLTPSYFPVPRAVEFFPNDDPVIPPTPKSVDRHAPMTAKNRQALTQRMQEVAYCTWIIVFCSTVPGGVGQIPNVDLVLSVIDEMRAKMLKPDEVCSGRPVPGLRHPQASFRAIVELCGRVGAKEQGMAILREMASNGMVHSQRA